MSLLKKNKKKIRKDMQMDNLYTVEMLRSTDWKAAKNADMLFAAMLEDPNQSLTISQLVAKMVSNGLDVDSVKESLIHRQSLRDKVVGIKDVDKLRQEYVDNKDRYSELGIKIDSYKMLYKSHKKELYPAAEFVTNETEYETLKQWLLDNKWIANHEMK